MNSDKICMVTGHRNLPAERISFIKAELRREVLQAIQDGYTHFLSGFALGTDLLFAVIVSDLKETYPITLEAAIPYRNRLKTKNAEFQRLLTKCVAVGIHSEEYTPDCFFKRNRFMVQLSNRVIAVYDGRDEGGTLSTMRYAQAMQKDLRTIRL